MPHTFHLIWHLVKRDFDLKYAGSMLGFLWSLVIPLTQLFILVFVFGKVIPLNIANFPVFVFTALLPWNWFSSSLVAAGSTFTDSRDLLRHPKVKPAIMVVVSILGHLLILFLSLPVLFFMLYWYNAGLPWLFFAAFPLLILLQGILTVGLSLIIATANVFYRDVAPIVGLGLSLLFFVTPVWYSPQARGQYGFLFEINPMSLIVQSYRQILLDHGGLDWRRVTVVALMSATCLMIGLLFYRRFESDVIDSI
jgi:lipopolysaccharide transport system permease protein